MADGWLYINCLWVSGPMKGHGYSNDLLEECIRDARAQGKNGLCILCAEGRKREFLADPKFLAHKGFRVADISDCGIDLMVLPLVPMWNRRGSGNAQSIRQLQKPVCPVLHRPVPLHLYWVPRVQEGSKGARDPVQAIHITDKESAQNVPAPVTTYALFRDGKFLTQSIQTDKNFWHWRESGTELSYIGKSSIHVRIRGAYPRSRRSARSFSSSPPSAARRRGRCTRHRR